MREYIELYVFDSDTGGVEILLLFFDQIKAFVIKENKYSTGWVAEVHTSDTEYELCKNSRGGSFKTKKEAREHVKNLEVKIWETRDL